MTENIKSSDTPRLNPLDALDNQLKASARSWKYAFFICLTILLLQSLYHTIKTDRIVGMENGKIIGEVIFDESRYRSPDIIISDLKNLISHCTSVNKNTITEDLAICLNHMEGSLAESRLSEWSEVNYVRAVSQSGCLNSEVIFDDSETKIIGLDRNSYLVNAELKAAIICDDGGSPISKDFYTRIEAKVLRRTEYHPYAIEIQDMKDI